MTYATDMDLDTTNDKTAKTTDHINSQEERDRLFHENISLANRLAVKKQRSMPKCVRLEDLKSAAYFGLLDAATRYDKNKHQEFQAYARFRIRGEINDYLRRCGWGGRNHPFYGWSLDVPVYGNRSRRPVPLEDSLTESPDLSHTEVEEFFLDVTKSLPQKIRNILRYYYLDNLTMKEIALIEGMCESRISQLMSHYKQVLQKIWAGREDDLWEAARPKHGREKFRFNLSIMTANADENEKSP